MNWPIYAMHTTEVAGTHGSGDAGVCPRCGCENDPFYTFCRDCVGRLPAIA
jgi:hypothetical protein